MNIREIAKKAKVSTATVSRTINRIPTVHPQLAKRVWKVVEELGYVPSTQARALVSGKSRIFGLIVSEITNPFFPEIVHVFEDIAVRHNYEILMTSTVHDPERMKTAVRRLLEHRVEGVAVLTFGMEESLLDDLKLRNVPLVFVDVGPARPRVSNIRIDYLHGIRQAVQHLVALRHERISFITGPLELKSAVARRDAFFQSMKELGMQVDAELVVEGNHSLEGGERALARLLKLKSPPTAVLCSNDLTAIGVMRKSYAEKVSIPEELSVVGFDNTRFSQYILPPLSTIEMSQAEIGRLAFQALLNDVQREQPNAQGTEYQLKTHFILRDSTAMNSRMASRAAIDATGE
ncbi:MAG TPA: LacI family DNA-binding transcriptional regulator [Candidatus Acidoferrum sp.]|nr:LacI family DNA-binding transcriptional regulator [Candidatus Acidoferrum sp.]